MQLKEASRVLILLLFVLCLSGSQDRTHSVTFSSASTSRSLNCQSDLEALRLPESELIECEVSDSIVPNSTVLLLVESSELEGISLSIVSVSGSHAPVVLMRESGLGEELLPIQVDRRTVHLFVGDLNEDRRIDIGLRTFVPPGTSPLFVWTYDIKTKSFVAITPFSKQGKELDVGFYGVFDRPFHIERDQLAVPTAESDRGPWNYEIYKPIQGKMTLVKTAPIKK